MRLCDTLEAGSQSVFYVTNAARQLFSGVAVRRPCRVVLGAGGPAESLRRDFDLRDKQ